MASETQIFPREMILSAYKAVRQLSRTLYKSTLFMQNKANFRKAQMNVNSLITKDYRKNDAFAVQKNKANSKPIKANLPEGKIDAMCVFTKDYEEKMRLRAMKKQSQFKANSKPILERMNANFCPPGIRGV